MYALFEEITAKVNLNLLKTTITYYTSSSIGLVKSDQLTRLEIGL